MGVLRTGKRAKVASNLLHVSSYRASNIIVWVVRVWGCEDGDGEDEGVRVWGYDNDPPPGHTHSNSGVGHLPRTIYVCERCGYVMMGMVRVWRCKGMKLWV